MTEVAAIDLNGRQELFAKEYAATGKGTQSAISAGYSAKTAYATASRLLKNVVPLKNRCMLSGSGV